MPRNISSGTPDRSPGYIFPGGRGKRLWIAILAGGVVALSVLLLYAVGQRRFTSPGPVVASHASVELRCAQCHDVGHGVADVRCERCHDPRGADRFTHPAHVLFGSGDSRKATSAPAVACTICHTDHRGRTAMLKAVDDRECGRCHVFSSLKAHPEFAAVRAQIRTGAGLSFGHQRHIAEVAKQQGKRCEACHEPTADLGGFQAIDFDRHCAACHTKDGFVSGDSEAVAPEYLVLSAQLTGARVPGTMPAELGRIVVSQMTHRDPWVLYNVRRLRRMIDPSAVSAEIAGLRVRAAYLTQQLDGPPLFQLAVADLQSWQAILENEIASIDTGLASQPSSATDQAALEEIRTVVRQIAAQLSAADPSIGSLDANARGQASPAGSTGPEPAPLVDARKMELLSLLDAIAQRGDTSLADRAATLRRQVEQVQAGPSNGQVDKVALTNQLRKLDVILGAVRATEDPQAGATASQLAALRDLAVSQVSGSLSPDAFEDRRGELLGALDAIDRNGNPALSGRVAVLRQRVLALQPGRSGDEGLGEIRSRKSKLLARVRLELELARTGDIAPSAAVSAADGQQLQLRLNRARAEVADLQSGGRADIAETPAELRKATTALNNLLTPCLKCHVTDGAKIAPVSPAHTVFQRATFTHKPHVEQETCVSCHSSIGSSTKATDINEPNVASCQRCHTPSKSRSDCAACHFYHPPSLTRVLGTM